jgi:hypothetical protein
VYATHHDGCVQNEVPLYDLPFAIVLTECAEADSVSLVGLNTTIVMISIVASIAAMFTMVLVLPGPSTPRVGIRIITVALVPSIARLLRLCRVG